MAYTVEIGGDRATVKNGVWTSDNHELADGLPEIVLAFWESGYYPDADLQLAKIAAKAFGGGVLDLPEDHPDSGNPYSSIGEVF